MNAHAPAPDKPPASDTKDHWAWQFIVTVGLLIAFGVLIVFMMANAKDADQTEWERHVYLFAAAEAIVFTSVGWLFGREVHRGEAKAAKQDAANAKQDADAARTEVMARSEEVAAERVKGMATKSFVRNMTTGAPRAGDVGQTVGAPDVNTPEALRAFVDDLWPD